ncbi:response regulator [Paenibacillus mesophilus]|uniref:ATP-binding protein n=1 Tax=Paenibacillus mesophilus TaxID=2582849 RepID=UPI00110D3895|nr:ATP-binding protein [Paenibacillus mesophilus]TMV47304.1 response regulator [Paenibacillus mesophilus]
MNRALRYAAYGPLLVLIIAVLVSALRNPIASQTAFLNLSAMNGIGWEIRVGDIPVRAAGSSGGWQPIGILNEPSLDTSIKEDYNGYYWLRAKLPGEMKLRDPQLFVQGYNHVQLFVETRMIYDFNMDPMDFKVSKFLHWGFAPLEPSDAGSMLYIRVLQNDSDPLAGTFLLGEKGQFYENMIARDMVRVIFCIMFLHISVTAFLVWAKRPKMMLFLYFGILTACAAYGSIGRAQLLLHVTGSPLLVYLQNVAVPLGAFALFGFLSEVYKGKFRTFNQISAWFNLIVAVAAGISAFVDDGTYDWIIEKGFLLTALLLMPAAIGILVRSYVRERDRDTFWILLGCSLFVLFALLHYVQVNVFPYDEVLIQYIPAAFYFSETQIVFGAMLFVLCLEAVFIFRFDETHRKVRLYAEELERKNEKLLELDRLKDDFLARTSHELRTPLYGMVGMAEALLEKRNGYSEPELDRRLSVMIASGRRLTRLINDILDHSKIKHHDLSLHKKPVDVRQVVELAMALLEEQANGKGIALVHTVSAQLPPVAADEDRLEQIFFNLIGNAIKFTIQGKVEVSAEARGNLLLVTVADTGEGIATEELETVFDPFVQAAAVRQAGYAGTGLGLTVSKQLIELHGGNIELQSEPGAGTAFHFSLPFWEAAESSDSTAEVAASSGHRPVPESRIAGPSYRAAEDGESEERDAAIPTIVVVDDEPINLDVLASHLEPEYKVIRMPGAAEALQWLEEHRIKPPELVITDIMMPKMSGYELCKRIRTSYRDSEIPVILLSAKSLSEDMDHVLQAGVNDFLTKPVSRLELLTRVRLHLRVRSLTLSLEGEVRERTEELEETNRQLQLSMQETLQAMEEVAILEERNRITHRIHDTVGHTLTASIMQLEAVKRLLASDTAAALQKLVNAQEVLREGLDSIRRFLRKLKEDEMKNDLTESLLQLIHTTRETAEVEIDAHIGSLPLLSGLHKKVIFQALQEGLTNGMKHGGRTFQFTLLCHEKVLDFSLKNNGAPYTPGSFGIGLAAIRERTAHLGGTLKISSALPDWGCDLKIRIPVNGKHQTI